MQCIAVCCSVLQCVAVCCSVLRCAAVCCSVLQWLFLAPTKSDRGVVSHTATHCSVLQCMFAVCCSVCMWCQQSQRVGVVSACCTEKHTDLSSFKIYSGLQIVANHINSRTASRMGCQKKICMNLETYFPLRRAAKPLKSQVTVTREPYTNTALFKKRHIDHIALFQKET